MTSGEKSVYERQFELLLSEINLINGAIRQHDDITKSIKNWAVLTWTAGMGAALNEKELHPFIWVTAVIPLVFWIVDASFRRVQRSFIARYEQIAEYVNSDTFTSDATTGGSITLPLLLMRKKTQRFKDSLLGTLCFRTVGLLYGGLAACSIGVWLKLAVID